jgi:hypothetical protein
MLSTVWRSAESFSSLARSAKADGLSLRRELLHEVALVRFNRGTPTSVHFHLALEHLDLLLQVADERLRVSRKASGNAVATTGAASGGNGLAVAAAMWLCR